METIAENIQTGVKILAIIFALFHFLAGFVFYRDMVRINNVIKTRKSGLFMFLSNLYLFILLSIVILFILI